MAGVLGFEPRQRVLEALVLTITLYTYFGECKIRTCDT